MKVCGGILGRERGDPKTLRQANVQEPGRPMSWELREQVGLEEMRLDFGFAATDHSSNNISLVLTVFKERSDVILYDFYSNPS